MEWNNIEDKSDNYSLEKKRRTTVHDATEDEIIVTGDPIANPTIYGPNDALVFDDTVSKNILEYLSTVLQPRRTEIMTTIWKYCAK